jgi:hypothetical protein
MLREANRGDRSGDLFCKLKADVRLTRQTSERRAAEALRILFVMGEDFAKDAIYLSSTKTADWPRADMSAPRVKAATCCRTPSAGVAQ